MNNSNVYDNMTDHVTETTIPLLFDLIAHHGEFTLADWATIRLICKAAAKAGSGMQLAVNTAIQTLRPTLQKMLGPVYDDLTALNDGVAGALGHPVYLAVGGDIAMIIHTVTVDLSVVDILISRSFVASWCRGARVDDAKVYTWRSRNHACELIDIVVWTEDIKKWLREQQPGWLMYISNHFISTQYYFTGKHIGVFVGADSGVCSSVIPHTHTKHEWRATAAAFFSPNRLPPATVRFAMRSSG